MKLTPLIIGAAIVLLALQGPATMLAGLENNPAQMSDPYFWRDVVAAAISNVASAYPAIVTVVAAAFGIPLLRAKPDVS